MTKYTATMLWGRESHLCSQFKLYCNSVTEVLRGCTLANDPRLYFVRWEEWYVQAHEALHVQVELSIRTHKWVRVSKLMLHCFRDTPLFKASNELNVALSTAVIHNAERKAWLTVATCCSGVGLPANYLQWWEHILRPINISTNTQWVPRCKGNFWYPPKCHIQDCP
jgi:hypothetical protein